MRFIALTAGPFKVALPLVSVRQLLDTGGERSLAPLDPRALGVAPISLARLLGASPCTERPALLLFDGHTGPVLLTACVLGGIFEPKEGEIRPLPPSVAVRWPDLIRGTLRHEGALWLVLDPHVLMGVVEVRAEELEAREGEGEGAREGMRKDEEPVLS